MDLQITIKRLKLGKTVRVTKRQFELLALEPGIYLKVESKNTRTMKVFQNLPNTHIE